MENKCLFCYKEISVTDLQTPAGERAYHPLCSKKFYGDIIPPEIDFSLEQLVFLAEKVIQSQKTVTGVQPKLSIGLEKEAGKPKRLTIVGILGEYILKPQTEYYANLPENEDLTMHLAEISKIKTVPHTLVQLKSGELAYLTKRVDRNKGNKLHMEDMCQLTERLTEHKYKGSYEQIAKAIKRHTANPGFDVVNYYELVLFSFLTGNNDMHLKNFSLLKKELEYSLCPAYDLVASELVVEGDDEELALNLNGKKKKIKRNDFVLSMSDSGIDEKVIHNVFKKYRQLIPKWIRFIDKSFLPDSTKEDYKKLIHQKASQIELL